MSMLAPSLQAFFVTRLGTERDVSPHTVDSYRHTFRLLLTYAKQRTGKAPSELELGDLDAALVSSFLEHLEHDRGCGVGTRNTRLAAVHSFFRFASYRHPEHAATIQQVLAIPQKKTERRPRSFLTTVEMEALLAAPEPQHLERATRPHDAGARLADRTSALGADRAAMPGCRARRRSACEVSWQRPKAPGHPAGQNDRLPPARLAERTRRRA
jgi:integrase